MTGYGIAIGDDGEVYDMGAGGATKVRSVVKETAQKAIAAQKAKVNAAAKKKAQTAKATSKAKVAQKAQAAKKAMTIWYTNQDFRGLEMGQNNMALGNHMRNLPGIGDGLAGFGEQGESVISDFGADFGSIFNGAFEPYSEPALSALPDCFGAEPGECGLGLSLPWSSAAKVAGDQLESIILKVIERRARIQQGDDAFYARMRALPASTAKQQQIAAYTKKAQAREQGAASKLYWQFANGVVTALESIDKKRAEKLKMLFSNPWMTIKNTKSASKALTTLAGDDALGVAPIILGVGVAAAVAGAGTAYITQSSGDLSAAEKEIRAQEEQLAKDKKLLESKSIPESAKVELAKSIASREASLTKQKEAVSDARIEVAKEKAAAGPLGLGALTSNLKWIAIFGGAAVLAFMFLPQIKAMLPAAKQPVKQGG